MADDAALPSDAVPDGSKDKKDRAHDLFREMITSPTLIEVYERKDRGGLFSHRRRLLKQGSRSFQFAVVKIAGDDRIESLVTDRHGRKAVVNVGTIGHIEYGKKLLSAAIDRAAKQSRDAESMSLDLEVPMEARPSDSEYLSAAIEYASEFTDRIGSFTSALKQRLDSTDHLFSDV